MFLQRGLAVVVRLRVAVAHIRGQRNFGIQNHHAIVRQVNIKVGSKLAALVAAIGLLHFIVAAALHAASVKDALQGELAPIALHFGVALESVGQVHRNLAGGGGGQLQVLNVGAQCCGLLDIGFVHFIYASAKASKLLLQRLQQGGHGCLIAFSQGLALGFKNAVGKIFKLRLHALFRVFKEFHFALGRFFLSGGFASGAGGKCLQFFFQARLLYFKARFFLSSDRGVLAIGGTASGRAQKAHGNKCADEHQNN